MNMHTAMPTLTRSGRGAVHLQARGAEPLALDEIARNCPSVLAPAPHSSRSEKYTYISTLDIMRGMAAEGFHPFTVQQGGSKDDEKRGFTKHMVRFRQEARQMRAVGDSIYEVCLLNSHDGTSSEQMFGGVMRLVCLNGMVVAEGAAAMVKIMHKGNVLEQVVQGAHAVVANGQKVVEHIEAFRAITLNRGEQSAFASAAAALRFDDSAPPIQPDTLLIPHRPADAGDDLWRTFNRVQENVIRGGIPYTQTREVQGRQREVRMHTKPIRSVDGDVKLNRALWVLAEELAKAKAA